MADRSLERVVLDACVLFPASLRDMLLRAAELPIYEVRWSNAILEEVRRNLVSTGRSEEGQARRLINSMAIAFPFAEVTGYEHHIPAMPNHPKDRHVLAAAVEVGAQIIVTDNLRDFPADLLSPFGVIAESPDAFLTRLFQINRVQMAQIMVAQAHDLHRPPKTVPEVLVMLAQHAPRFVALVRQELG